MTEKVVIDDVMCKRFLDWLRQTLELTPLHFAGFHQMSRAKQFLSAVVNYEPPKPEITDAQWKAAQSHGLNLHIDGRAIVAQIYHDLRALEPTAAPGTGVDQRGSGGMFAAQSKLPKAPYIFPQVGHGFAYNTRVKDDRRCKPTSVRAYILGASKFLFYTFDFIPTPKSVWRAERRLLNDGEERRGK